MAAGQLQGRSGAEGAGVTVVLLPPLDQTCAHFDAVLALLPDVDVLPVERPRLRRGAVAVRGLVDDLADLEESVRGCVAPLVLLGASYGGLLARTFAGRRPHRVRGLVLVDAVHEDVYDGVAAAVGDQAGEVLANGEGLDLVVALRQARRLVAEAPLDDVPVVALARDRLHDDERAVHPEVDTLDRVWREHQERLGGCSRRARLQVVAGAGHLIALEAPQEVAAAVREVALTPRAAC